MLTPTPSPMQPGNEFNILAFLETIFTLLGIASVPTALWYDKWRNRRKPDLDKESQERANDAAQIQITANTLAAAKAAIDNYQIVLVRLAELEKVSTANTLEIRKLNDDKYTLECKNRDQVKTIEEQAQTIEKLTSRVKLLEDFVVLKGFKIQEVGT